ncbi:hypothetical protein EKPJFOCH_2250 [Methylobacterium thuringiense]|uniref:Lipoprotein n=2 Tax=Methylobacterium thuringiense TaxID=1003091 RepID=A0ABQ4TNX2_9HYPH|nr:hypothetical protein EKPJFOCH_2250 [Methylobacterium thuringiense]
MRIAVALCILGVALGGCMSTAEKQKAASEKAKTYCYANGFNEGTDPFNRCVAGAGLVFTDELERDQRAKRQDFADRLGRASEAMQSLDRRASINCTSTKGLGQTVETSCN